MNAAERLAALRAELARQGLDGFIVPRADEHLGEYVPAGAERLAWLTGFTGSAGLAAILPDRAAVFTDGRYVLQLAAQTDAALWERRHIIEEPPPGWLAAHATPGARIGYDPLLVSEEGLARYAEAGLAMIAASRNPVDAVWPDRPGPPMAPALPHPLHYRRPECGREARAGRRDAAHREAGCRDPHRPGVDRLAAEHPWLGRAVHAIRPRLRAGARRCTGRTVHGTGQAAGRDARLARQRRDDRGAGRRCCPRSRVSPASGCGSMPRGSPVWFAQVLREAGAEVVAAADPCLLPKACKNPVEQQGARDAHRRDAVAVCRFLHFLSEAGPAGTATEISAAERLLRYRAEVEGFRGESFPAISGAGEHGAIIHYRVTEETDRPIRPDEVYLIDSGGQFLDGTTDITRTVWTGKSVCATGAARAGDQGDARGISRSRPWCFRRVWPARISTPSPVARCGRWGSTTTTAPGTASAAICRCMKARSACRGQPSRCRSRPA